MSQFKHKILSAILALSASGSAMAVDVSFNGFGSFIVGKTVSQGTLSMNSPTTYLASPTFGNTTSGQPNADASYDDDWSYRPDTKLGFQLNLNSDSGFGGTLQATMHGANDLHPEIEWAYVNYDATPDFRINVGQQRIPLFLYSDYLDVGYAQHWVRAPMDVYGVGVSAYKGGSASYRFDINSWSARVEGYYAAEANNDTDIIWRSRMEDLSGVVLTAQKDWLTLRTSYHYADALYSDTDNLLVFPAKTITENNPAEGHFASLGFTADFDEYFAAGEYVYLNADPFYDAVVSAGNIGIRARSGTRTAYMLTAGKRINDLTLHATYSRSDAEIEIPAAGFNDLKRSTLSAGVRWDFTDNMAFKAEITDASDISDSAVKSLLGDSMEATVLAFGIDYVF